MQDNLVIVESPAKAKTIEKILGENFLVKSSYGHIRDLAKGKSSIDFDNGFEPQYIISPDKIDVVKQLKSLAKKAKTVYLASDEDREGEAIAWHLHQALELDNVDTKRIVFHEITPTAIKNAVENPRTIDQNLVDAQQARRILDRLVGFELSPLLWKKVKPALSAGRVQSVTVKLIVEREREIMNFSSSFYYKITAEFISADGHTIKATLKDKISSIEAAQEFLEQAVEHHFQVQNVTQTPLKRSPAPPLTTSTLQQEASLKFGYAVSQTMSIAQKLYEAGHITYMRTDSVNLSQTALNAAKNEINASFGEEYYKFRTYKTKSAGAQEAHEAIRPTHFENHDAGNTAQEKKLYQLIWKRTVATQMADAQLLKTNIDISAPAKHKFIATGQVILFDGFLKLYIAAKNDDENGDDHTGEHSDEQNLLPPVKIGEDLSVKNGTLKATQKFTQKPPRYNEASLVKQLEVLGIGRPSTYAPTITTVISRGYVVKDNREPLVREYNVLTVKGKAIDSKIEKENTGAEKNKLFPTDIGMIVNDFLQVNFTSILNYGFTADVEQQFDKIASGEKNWRDMLKEFYTPFHKTVEATQENAEYVNSERELGLDPKSGKMIIARVGRYGPMVQIGEVEDKKFAKLRSDMLIETMTLEQAISLFELPRTTGQYEDMDMVVAIGRFGAYVRHDGKFTSLAKTDDPYTVSSDRCIELIEEKREKDRNKFIKDFPDNDINVLNGRFGPYIAHDGANYKIPKTVDPQLLTLEDCLKLVEEQKNSDKAPKRKFGAKTSAAAKKTGAKKKVAKKTVAKKTVAKKPAVKKTTATKAPATKKVAKKTATEE